MPTVYDKVKREARIFSKLEQSASHSAGVDLRFGTEYFEWYLSKIFNQHPTLIQFMKSNDFGTNDLGGKKLAALIALKYDKSDLYDSLVEQVKEENRIEEQKRKEFEAAQKKEREEKEIARINAVKQYLPNIELLHDAVTIHKNSSPFMPAHPKLNLDGSVSVKVCTDGVYVVRSNMTIFHGTNHYGTYYCEMTVFEKKGNLFNILLSHSFYSGLYGIGYGTLGEFKECEVGDHSDMNVIPFSIFMENNYTILKEFNEKNSELITNHRVQEYIRSDN